jgi:TRAP-type C4-dicarboxylate transport system permease small subunit
MKQFSGLVQRMSRTLDIIAGFCIVATMVIVVINVLLRAFLRKPLLGTMDYVTLLMALTIGLGLAYCGFNNGHIAVDLIIDKLPKKAQAIIDAVTDLISLIFWGAVAWYMAEYARTMALSNLVAPTIQIPLSPIIYVVSFGLLMLCLVILVKTIDSVRKVAE